MEGVTTWLVRKAWAPSWTEGSSRHPSISVPQSHWLLPGLLHHLTIVSCPKREEAEGDMFAYFSEWLQDHFNV